MAEGVDVRLVVPPADAPPQAPVATPSTPARPPSPSSPAGLPRTGVEVLALVVLAVVLLALGSLLIKAGRTRRLRRPA